MATPVHIHVDPAATGAADGSDWADAYVSVDDAMLVEAGDISQGTGSDEEHFIHCRSSDGSADTDDVPSATISDYTTDEANDNRVHLIGYFYNGADTDYTDSVEFSGAYDGSEFRIRNTNNADTFQMDIASIRMRGIQMEMAGSYSNQYCIDGNSPSMSADIYWYFDRCFFWQSANSNNPRAVILNNPTSGSNVVVARNCTFLVTDDSHAGYQYAVISGDLSPYYYNCNLILDDTHNHTSDHCHWHLNTGTSTFRNCILWKTGANQGAYNGTGHSADYCGDNAGETPGSNDTDLSSENSGIWDDFANQDYHLDDSYGGGNPCEDAGTDLSAASYSFTTDFEVHTRSDWDLGVDEEGTTGATDADVNPTVISQAQAVVTPALATGSSVSPATPKKPYFTLPAPTVSTSTSVEVSATVVSQTQAVVTPTLTIGEDPAPSVVAQVQTVVTPTVATGADAAVSPAALGQGQAVVTPALATGTAATLGPAVQTQTIPAETVSVGEDADVQPAALAQGQTVITPAIATGSAVAAGPASQTQTVVTPGVSAGGDADVQPAALTQGQAVVTPAVATGTAATLGPVAQAQTVLTPGVSAGGDASVQPAAVVQGQTAVSSTVQTGSGASPAALSQTQTIPAPTVAGAASVAPAAISQTQTVVAPGISAGDDANVQPSTVSQTQTVVSATVATGSAVAASVISQTQTVPAAVVTGADTPQEIIELLVSLTTTAALEVSLTTTEALTVELPSTANFIVFLTSARTD